METTLRTRAHVGTSVKGIKTPEATIELTTVDKNGDVIHATEDRELVLMLLDKLSGELDKRFPPQKGE